jgi:hypothetical protein
MVGRPYRTTIEHRTGATQFTIEDRMEGAAGRVIATQYSMIERTVTPGTVSHTALCVEVKLISPYDLVSKPAVVDRRHEFDVVFFHFHY